MFGLFAARPVSARQLLRDAPRSLRELSQEHQDGWGIATRTSDDWRVHRSISCAARCTEFGELVEHVATRLLIAHVRRKTVGATSLANTHPFQRGSFVFAHNGTVTNTAALATRTSAARLAEIAGDTDSERLFAFVLTRIDEASEIELGITTAVRELHAIAELGSATFLLSCGRALYAHRFGRPLCVLERHRGHEARRTEAIAIASEPLTSETWIDLAEGSLVAVDGGESPVLRSIQ